MNQRHFLRLGTATTILPLWASLPLNLNPTISVQCYSCDAYVAVEAFTSFGTDCPQCDSLVGQLASLDDINISRETLSLVSGALARSFAILPLAATKSSLTFATCYPHSEPQLIEKLRHVFNTPVVLRYADREQLLTAIKRLLPDASEPDIEIV